MEVKRNVSFVEKYQENATSKSESMVPLQPIASPSESVTPLQPLTSQPIAIQPIPSPISIWQAVNPSSPMLKQARDQLQLVDFLNDLMIMNCQRHGWTL